MKIITDMMKKRLVTCWLIVMLIPVGMNAQQAITHGGKKRQTSEQQSKKPKEAAGYDVTISCNVPSATIYIDGNNNGTANGSRFLKTGSHTIKLIADGYESLTQSIQVNSKSRSFSFTMKKETVLPSNNVSTPKECKMTVDDHLFFLLDERNVSGNGPRDFNIYDNIKLTIENAQGKTIWMETRFYDANTHSAITPTNSQYRVGSGNAGSIKSTVIDSDYSSRGYYTVTPLSSLGLSNGMHHLLVMTFIYIGTDPNSPTTKTASAKVLHFSKYGNNVSEMTITDD